MTDELLESKVAESANAAAVATEAQHNAIIETVRNALADGLRQVLVDDDNSPILVKSKIKRICDSQEKQAVDIQDIHTVLNDMANDTKWMKRILSGATGVIVVVFLPIVGWLLLQVVKNSSSIAVLQHVTH